MKKINMKQDSKAINKDLKLYYKLGTQVHVVIQNTKKFYNGFVKYYDGEYIELKDRKTIKPIPIRIDTIFSIVPYEEK